MEFSDIFTWDKSKFRAAEAKFPPQKIPVINNSPIYQPPYRVSQKEREIIEEQVEILKNSGAIYESTSPWGGNPSTFKK